MIAIGGPVEERGAALGFAQSVWRLGDSLVRLVTSRRTALTLMALFVTCLAIQALLPQRGTISTVQYALWQARYPPLARILETLGMDQVSSTPWFLALGFALAVSLGSSTARRAVSLLRHDPVPHGPEVTQEVWPSDKNMPEVARALRRRGYAVTLTQEGLSARRGMLASWGSLGFHGGLVLLFLGALVSAATRFTGFVELAPGQVFDEGSGYVAQRSGPLASQAPALSLAVLETEASFWPDGTVKDIWAHIALQEGDGSFAEGIVRRNQDLSLGASSVTLGSPFGPAVLLRYEPGGGEKVVQGYVHFPSDGQSFRNRFIVPTVGVEVQVELEGPWPAVLEGGELALPPRLLVTATDAERGLVREELVLGQAAAVTGGDLRFVSLEPWALFMVARDRGLPILIVGSVLALVGLALALFIVPRWVWVTGRNDGWRIVGRSPWAVSSLLVELRALEMELLESGHD